jgi:hypothetical protein
MKTYSILAGVTFILHYLWEYSHLPLYGGYENLSPFLPISVWASIGDVLYTLGVVFLIALIKRSLSWIQSATWHDFAALAIMGFAVAVFVEYKAFAYDKWYYLETMPVIPFLDVGLSPVLQMAVLLPLTVFVAMCVDKRLS